MKFQIMKPEEANRRVLFCNNLRYMLNNGPINHTELAKRLGLSYASIISYSKGRTFPNDERIRQIADALECTVEDLFDETYAPWKFGEE